MKKNKLSLNVNDLKKRLPVFFCCILIVVSFFFLSHYAIAFYCTVLFACITYELYLLRNLLNDNCKQYHFLLIYALGFSGTALACFYYIFFKFGANVTTALIIITSSFDIGGYVFGKALQGPKLCPTISPNKTWTGFIGGFILTNVCFTYFNSYFQVNFNFFFLQLLILMAFLGDLLESMFKRKLQIKDTSNLLMGHGGFLDRFDSIMFVSIAFILFKIFYIG